MSPRFHLLWLWAMFAIQGGALFGNSYEWHPLDRLPAETNVVAFANRPAEDHQQTLSRQEAMRFLSQGAFQKDPEYGSDFMHAHPSGKTYPSCCGVFVTKDGSAYFWRLDSERLMRIVTDEGRRCFVSLPPPGAALLNDPDRTSAGTYRPSQNAGNWHADTYGPLSMPKTDEVRWFFNDHEPGSGPCLLRSKTAILSLLKVGKQVPCACLEDEFELRKNAWLTLPPAMAQTRRQFGGAPAEEMRGDAIKIGLDTINADFQVQGIIVTRKGKVFYWKQWGDHLLALRDDKGGCSVLQSP